MRRKAVGGENLVSSSLSLIFSLLYTVIPSTFLTSHPIISERSLLSENLHPLPYLLSVFSSHSSLHFLSFLTSLPIISYLPKNIYSHMDLPVSHLQSPSSSSPVFCFPFFFLQSRGSPSSFVISLSSSHLFISSINVLLSQTVHPLTHHLLPLLSLPISRVPFLLLPCFVAPSSSFYHSALLIPLSL